MTAKICSFNLRAPFDNDGFNHFNNRKGRIAEIIFEHAPDLIGFQECREEPRVWLDEILRGKYTVLGCGREADLTGESTSIAYKTNEYSLISLDNIWLSGTPDVPGSTYGGDQSRCPRMFTAARLVHNKSLARFVFVNTHLDHEGKNARLLGAMQITQWISRADLPFILTGDMNAQPSSEPVSVFLNNAARQVVDTTSLITSTFHGFGKLKTPNKIDYIFTDMPSNPLRSFAVEDNPADGLYISDHNPVFAFVEI